MKLMSKQYGGRIRQVVYMKLMSKQ